MSANFGFFRLFGVAIGTVALGCSVAAGASAQEAAPARPAAAADPALDLAADLTIGRALFLRCLCKADNLTFDLVGHPEGKSQPVDWTLAAVDIAKIKRTGPERIELDGTRAALRWNSYNENFDRKPLKLEPVHITLNGAADPASTRRAIDAVFSLGIDRALQLSTPPYWQHFFNPAQPWPNDPVEGTVLRAGDKVNGAEVPTPAVMKKAAAGYTEESARDRVEGPVVLQLIVDSTGAEHHIRVVTPLGYGLDAAAVAALEKTQFSPAMVNGQPATVIFFLRENFSVVPPAQ